MFYVSEFHKRMIPRKWTVLWRGWYFIWTNFIEFATTQWSNVVKFFAVHFLSFHLCAATAMLLISIKVTSPLRWKQNSKLREFLQWNDELPQYSGFISKIPFYPEKNKSRAISYEITHNPDMPITISKLLCTQVCPRNIIEPYLIPEFGALYLWGQIPKNCNIFCCFFFISKLFQ